MSINEIREIKIKQLEFLALSEEQKDFVVKACKEIRNAESDELACKIANKQLKKLRASKLTNIVDTIVILLKGGYIKRSISDPSKPKEAVYLLFIPVPNPPYEKTAIGNIYPTQFNQLCAKGLITEQEDMRHIDDRGRVSEYFYLAEDIASLVIPVNPKNTTTDLYSSPNISVK